MYENFFLVLLFVLFVVPWLAEYFTGKAHWYGQNVVTLHFLLHTIFFVETEFDVDSNDVLKSFQCVGMMPSISVFGYHHSTAQFFPDTAVLAWLSISHLP